MVPKEVNICFRGKTFRKVKWIPGNNSAWFSGNDNLKGTHTVGIEGDDEREWAIDFSSMTFDNFLFASGDFFNWIWTSDAFLNKDASGTPQMYGTSDGYKSFDVLQSSLNAQAHQLSYFKFNNAAHPYVRTTGDDADALYLDNSVKYAPSLPGFQSHGGMGVYIQTADSCASDVPVKFFEHPNTSSALVDTCTHKHDYSTIKTDVDACKALDAQACSGTNKCRIQEATEKVFEGRTWNLVKWLPASSTNWFSTNDNLAGTAVVGSYGNRS